MPQLSPLTLFLLYPLHRKSRHPPEPFIDVVRMAMVGAIDDPDRHPHFDVMLEGGPGHVVVVHNVLGLPEDFPACVFRGHGSR